MIASRLRTKRSGVPATSPASTTFFMFSPSADANTSAAAPSMICRASVDEPAKLNSTLVPGCAVSKSFPIVRNASVSDAAANTVSVAPPAAEPTRISSPSVAQRTQRVLISRDFLSARRIEHPDARDVRDVARPPFVPRRDDPRAGAGPEDVADERLVGSRAQSVQIDRERVADVAGDPPRPPR